MQKFKHTFKRSKTPTGAEMKIQSSLEVPKQIRSASFDEMKLGSHRTLYEQSSLDVGSSTGDGLLQVPFAVVAGQRSKSFDSSGGGGISPPEESPRFLDVPGRQMVPRKKTSGERGSVYCVHCLYLEEMNKGGSRQSSGDDGASSRSLTYSDASSEAESDSEDDYADEENSTDASECISTVRSPFRITVTMSPNVVASTPRPPSTLDIPKFGDEDNSDVPQMTSRRRSITSPKLERQGAFIFNESGENLLEQLDSSTPSPKPEDVIISEIYLTVPDLKRDRAVSVDSCFISKSSHSGKPEEVMPVPASQLLEPPSLVNNASRSRSVDIVLPTDEQARYKALSTSNTVSLVPRFQDAVAPSTVVNIVPPLSA